MTSVYRRCVRVAYCLGAVGLTTVPYFLIILLCLGPQRVVRPLVGIRLLWQPHNRQVEHVGGNKLLGNNVGVQKVRQHCMLPVCCRTNDSNNKMRQTWHGEPYCIHRPSKKLTCKHLVSWSRTEPEVLVNLILSRDVYMRQTRLYLKRNGFNRPLPWRTSRIVLKFFFVVTVNSSCRSGPIHEMSSRIERKQKYVVQGPAGNRDLNPSRKHECAQFNSNWKRNMTRSDDSWTRDVRLFLGGVLGSDVRKVPRKSERAGTSHRPPRAVSMRIYYACYNSNTCIPRSIIWQISRVRLLMSTAHDDRDLGSGR